MKSKAWPRSWQYRWDLVAVLTHKDLKARYKRMVLGYAWSLANPLAFGLVYYLAFKIVMRVPTEDYALFLIAGLFPWQWLANTVGLGPVIFLSNAGMIKKVSFPKPALPLSITLQDMLHYLLAIPVIVLLLVLFGYRPAWTWLWGIPLFTLAETALAFGCSLAVATANVFFRDLERLVSLLLTLGFFLTPIVYPAAMVPAPWRGWLYLNPAAPLIVGWRELFMHGRFLAPEAGLSAAYGLLACAAGYACYRLLAPRLAEAL